MKKDRTFESIITIASQIDLKHAELSDMIITKHIDIRTSKHELRKKIENPDTQDIIPTTYKPLNEIIVPKESPSIHIHQLLERKEPIPKQWKTKQIFEFIQKNEENHYKTHCEQGNDISKHTDWEQTWSTFVLSVKGKSYQESESIIRAFVENLRRIRHNQLCAKDIVEKEDREQWPAITVVRAFLEGKLDKFKMHTEIHAGEHPNDPKWIKRWSSFVASLEQHRSNERVLKDLCSKFMTAQRIKKYRASKKE